VNTGANGSGGDPQDDADGIHSCTPLAAAPDAGPVDSPEIDAGMPSPAPGPWSRPQYPLDEPAPIDWTTVGVPRSNDDGDLEHLGDSPETPADAAPALHVQGGGLGCGLSTGHSGAAGSTSLGLGLLLAAGLRRRRRASARPRAARR
jgi:hypothetical protein